MVRRRRGRPHIPDEIQVEIERLAYLEVPSAEIEKRLKQKFGEAVAPSLRTIQRLVAKLTPTDPSSPWSLADAEGDDAELILPVLASVIEKTEGERQHLTRAEADWIERIRRAAPDLPPTVELFWLARDYILRTEREESTADIDAFLAFAPWRLGEPRQRYLNALGKEWTTPSPLLDTVAADIIELAADEEWLRRMARARESSREEDTDVRETR